MLISFWHLPEFWDAAVLNPLIHAVEHASFLLIGILIGSSMQTLTDRAKLDVLVLGFFGHFGYGLVLISNYRLYPLYSLADQGLLGIVMFSVGPFYWTGILYLIFRNKAWFREVPTGARPFEAPSAPVRHSDREGVRRLRQGARLTTRDVQRGPDSAAGRILRLQRGRDKLHADPPQQQTELVGPGPDSSRLRSLGTSTRPPSPWC